MKITYRLMLIAAFATFPTQASAQSVYDSRYEMIQQDQPARSYWTGPRSGMTPGNNCLIPRTE